MGMRSSVLVKPFINMEIRKYTDDHPDCGKILLLPPLDRRAAEKNLLFKNFRNFKAFKKLSDFTLGEVVGALVLQEFEANRAIFKQGKIIHSLFRRYWNWLVYHIVWNCVCASFKNRKD